MKDLKVQALLKLKKTKSLYDIALDIGISESSLYNYVNKYKPVGKSITEKIERYINSVR